MDERMDCKDLLPTHWIVQDSRVLSIRLTHLIDDVFELVSGGASRAAVIPGYEDSPDLYPVWSPPELGEALIQAGRLMVSLTRPDKGLN
jgi:hypothetical protein